MGLPVSEIPAGLFLLRGSLINFKPSLLPDDLNAFHSLQRLSEVEGEWLIVKTRFTNQEWQGRLSPCLFQCPHADSGVSNAIY